MLLGSACPHESDDNLGLHLLICTDFPGPSDVIQNSHTCWSSFPPSPPPPCYLNPLMTATLSYITLITSESHFVFNVKCQSPLPSLFLLLLVQHSNSTLCTSTPAYQKHCEALTRNSCSLQRVIFT